MCDREGTMSLISGIYPGYDGKEINPMVLCNSMVKLQMQEESLIPEINELSRVVDGLNYHVDKVRRAIKEFEGVALAKHQNDLPEEVPRNQDARLAYIMHVMVKDERDKLNRELNELLEKLWIKQAELNAAKTVMKTIQNSINTATQVLSYLKQSEFQRR